jgi:hypothetical protein
MTAPLHSFCGFVSFLLSKIFFKASGEILRYLNILRAITPLPAQCFLVAFTLREYHSPLSFGVAICVYPAVRRMLDGCVFVFSVFMADVWAAVSMPFGIRAGTAESPNVAGCGATFALVAPFLIVLPWNERPPTPDPVLFWLMASLFVPLTVFGWSTDKLGECSTFNPANKADTSVVN